MPVAQEMGGQPRIDVLCNMSGIFRDSFQVRAVVWNPACLCLLPVTNHVICTSTVLRVTLKAASKKGPPEAQGSSPRFRLSFYQCFRLQNVVELLDDLFQRAAAAPEPPDRNYVRKHALAMQADGLSNSAARLFSNPAGAVCAIALIVLGWSTVESAEHAKVYCSDVQDPCV